MKTITGCIQVPTISANWRKLIHNWVKEETQLKSASTTTTYVEGATLMVYRHIELIISDIITNDIIDMLMTYYWCANQITHNCYE